MMSASRLLNPLLTIYYLIVLFVCSDLMIGSSATCYSRRCLANKLVGMELFSPPMPPECVIIVNLTSIQYETLSVDTKQLRFSSRIRIHMEWTDPNLIWNISLYEFEEIMIPVNKIWTPDLTVDNAVKTEVKPFSSDILVRNDGTVKHSIQLYTTVVCGINLYTYPFVEDACPIALNGWRDSNCGLYFLYGAVSSVGATRGEWQTLSVELTQGEENLDRNYLYVTMSINPFDTVVTLILPSVLIMLADLGSFALPLEEDKRSNFKITLVLSFTMSLLILTEHLPDTGVCSPIIRYHFCFCLIVLVLSLLISLVLSRLASSGKDLKTSGKDKVEKDLDLKSMPTISVDVNAKDASIEKIVAFVERLQKTEQETKKKYEFASRIDRIIFRCYVFIDFAYVVCLICVTRAEICKINNLDFWM